MQMVSEYLAAVDVRPSLHLEVLFWRGTIGIHDDGSLDLGPDVEAWRTTIEPGDLARANELGVGEAAQTAWAEWTPPPPPPEPTLEESKAALKAGLAARRWAIETGGVTVAGVAIRTDRESQALVDAMQRALADGIIETVHFKVASGTIVQADLAVASAIRTAVVLHVQACRTREAELAVAIDAAADAGALQAIDVATGWPG